ncbi:hypothetical protein C8J57DRAFT_1247733 [Mycena rebaudengoi]|nr:hypothetical protein C8J57DRAFT_1247733 [Mycena rebaudengoi]
MSEMPVVDDKKTEFEEVALEVPDDTRSSQDACVEGTMMLYGLGARISTPEVYPLTVSMLEVLAFVMGAGSKTPGTGLVLLCEALAHKPSKYWDTDTKPLEYWMRLSKDSNAKQISRIAIKIFSILLSEICDEPTASRLGWFNAARRSSMLPEVLVGCAQLYKFYTHRISEGNYSHTPNVVLSEVYTGAGTTVNRLAPTLMDLIHEKNVSPSQSMADKEAYNQLLFNHPDLSVPYAPCHGLRWLTSLRVNDL